MIFGEREGAQSTPLSRGSRVPILRVSSLPEALRVLQVKMRMVCSKESDQTRQAFLKIFKTSGRLTPELLDRALIANFGIKLSSQTLGQLFDHVDKDNNGSIDFNEFVTGIQQADYNNKDNLMKFVADRAVKEVAELKERLRPRPKSWRESRGSKRGHHCSSAKHLAKALQEKVNLRTSRQTDITRQAQHMLGHSPHITATGLFESANELGVRCTRDQASELLRMFGAPETGMRFGEFLLKLLEYDCRGQIKPPREVLQAWTCSKCGLNNQPESRCSVCPICGSQKPLVAPPSEPQSRGVLPAIPTTESHVHIPAPISWHTAIQRGNMEALKLAFPLDAKAPIPPPALHLAASMGNGRAVKWLLRCGARDDPGPDGMTAFDIARNHGHPRMAALLRSHALPALTSVVAEKRPRTKTNWWSMACQNSPTQMMRHMNRSGAKRGVMTL